MQKLKHLIWILFFSITLSTFLTACSDPHENRKSAKEDPNAVRVGIVLGVEPKWLEMLKEAAEQEYDLHVKFIAYVDLEEINNALEAGEVDTNIFQTHVLAEYFKRKKGYRFTELGRTYLFPIGIYSKKIKSLLQLRNRAVVAVPFEPTNEARALFLLEKVGLIHLKSDNNLESTVKDITDNPRHLQILELHAREVVDILPTVDIALINIGYAVPAGLSPSKDAIALETNMTDYASVMVVREGEEKDPRLVALLEALRSKKVQAAIQKIFNGQVMPAWK